MNGLALYNEIDDFAAAWLEQLIAAGQIAPGIVDRRSIEDLDPGYVRQFTQVHFFAGIGVWSRALRDAGWSDTRPIWTGSCPCPPFSSAGKKKACPECGGTNPVPHIARTGYFVCCLCEHEWLADRRHLWPELWRLIRDCRPVVVLGEQVAGKDGAIWFDTVRASVEMLAYSAGAIDTPASSVGAPHIRQRLYWCALADAEHDGLGQYRDRMGSAAGARQGKAGERQRLRSDLTDDGTACGLAQPHDAERRADLPGRDDHDGPDAGTAQATGHVGAGGSGGGLADTLCDGTEHRPGQGLGAQAAPDGRDGSVPGQRLWPGEQGALLGLADASSLGHDGWRASRPCDEPGEVERLCDADQPGPTNGFWRAADWLGCRDERWRPVEPGTFPLAHGAPARVGRLRGYGNAIVLPQATAFVETIQEYLGVTHAA